MSEQREIKFRFYTPDKRMIEDHDGWIENTGINAALGYSNGYGYKIMQYTGLKDKNGKEIYEGDILKNRFGNYALEYYAPEFQLQNFDNYGIDGEYPAFEESEIIGNIHEHPNLLT